MSLTPRCLGGIDAPRANHSPLVNHYHFGILLISVIRSECKGWALALFIRLRPKPTFTYLLLIG